MDIHFHFFGYQSALVSQVYFQFSQKLPNRLPIVPFYNRTNKIREFPLLFELFLLLALTVGVKWYLIGLASWNLMSSFSTANSLSTSIYISPFPCVLAVQ